MTTPVISVLLIEDNPGDTDLVREYLAGAEASFVVEDAPRLAEGLKRLARGGIDLVLLDLSLPDSHGLETLDRLLVEAPFVPVVILTGLQEDDLGLEAVSMGAQDYLVKGQFSGPNLKRVIRFGIERFRAAEKLRQQESHLRMLTEQLPAVLWTTDCELRFTSGLGSGLQRLNVQPAELMQMSLFDLFQTQDAEFPAIVAHRRALQGESVLFDLDWRERTFQTRVEPLRQGNHMLGAIGVALDITDRKRVEEELLFAQAIQRGLLPKSMPTLPGMEVGGCTIPAVATGGDFYDCMTLGDGSICLVIGDVSGHGFGPALLAAVLHASLRTLTLTGQQFDLATMLATSNRLLCADSADDQFATLFLVHLDSQARSLTFSNAGHPPGLILAPTGEVRTRLDSTGSLLGVSPEEPFLSGPVTALEAGEIALFITDGVFDAESPEGHRFGWERIREVVHAHREGSAREISEALCAAAQSFCQEAPQRDDITAVVVKILAAG